MELKKFHILKYLKTDKDIIAYVQAVFDECSCNNKNLKENRKNLENVLREVIWALRLRNPIIRKWLKKLNKKSNNDKK